MENLDRTDEAIIDKVKVFSSDDEKLKVLGELLSNKTSRDIIRLLIKKEMYTNEIAKKLELSRNLVSHHLQKMKSIGLVEISNKKIIRKGEEHRFFRIPYGMLIFPQPETKVNKEYLKRLFKDGIKFMVVGIAGFTTWLGLNNISTERDGIIYIPRENVDITDFSNGTIGIIPEDVTKSDVLTSIVITSIVIGCGLFLIWYSKK